MGVTSKEQRRLNSNPRKKWKTNMPKQLKGFTVQTEEGTKDSSHLAA